jgi:hypothetical protein
MEKPVSRRRAETGNGQREAMRTISAIAGLLLASVAIASDDDAPLHFHQPGLKVYVHSHSKPISVVAGINQIGNDTTFICKSAAGCIVSLTASLHANGTANTQVCIKIDGKELTGACWLQINYVGTAFGTAKVEAGTHVIRLLFGTAQDNTVFGWSEEYRIYERKVRGTKAARGSHRT